MGQVKKLEDTLTLLQISRRVMAACGGIGEAASEHANGCAERARIVGNEAVEELEALTKELRERVNSL